MFSQGNIPYNTQLVPLDALYAELGHELESANAKARLERWYWAGIFGEMYGSSVETQYARDLAEVADYIRDGTEPTLIREANFAPTRLISLKTRQSAAYKGLYSLQMKNGAADWRTNESLTLADWHNENIDNRNGRPLHWTGLSTGIRRGQANFSTDSVGSCHNAERNKVRRVRLAVKTVVGDRPL